MRIILLMIFIHFNSFSQSYYLGYNESEKSLASRVEKCINDKNYIRSSQYDTNHKAISDILNRVGVTQDIKLIPCTETNNAIALTKNGVRYILYDPNFLNFRNKNQIDLPSLYIIAHEIGHHVNGHTIDAVAYSQGGVKNISLIENRRKELEADYFAGRIIRDLGYSLEQSAFAFASIFFDGQYSFPNRNSGLSDIENEILFGEWNEKCRMTDKYSTHPNRKNRGGAYGLGARYASVTSFKRNLPLLMKRGGIDCKRIKKDNKPWEIELNRECCGF
jgi:hypothetical protein